MSEYKHGAYGVLGESVARASSVAETVPVYIGTAPVNLVRGWDQTGAVGVPVKVTGALDAQAKIGHAQDWAAYTLCEAVAAHYDAGEDGIGPIYVINVLDPSTHCAKADTEATLTFAAGKAVIDSTSIILDTLRVGAGEGTAYAEGEDYTVSYNFAAGRATIASADPDRPIQGDVPCTWREVDPSKVTASEVAEAVSAVALLYQEQFAVPNILAAPGWSDSPEVYRALVAGAAKVNGHWDAYVMADLPLSDAKKKPVDTISGAIAWKDENGYSSERSSVFWPHAADATGRVFHLSTLAVAEAMRADAANDGVPFEGWSNRAVPVVRQRFAEGSKSRGFDQVAANQLNERGISSVVGWGGEWVLWGPHTAAFRHGGSHDARATFATGVRMLYHLTNGFQARWASAIDGPMTLALRDRILNAEQEQLDALVAMGALAGLPTIVFESASNPGASVAEGDFVFDAAVTPVVPLKSATVRVSYTDAGLSAYIEEEE